MSTSAIIIKVLIYKNDRRLLSGFLRKVSNLHAICNNLPYIEQYLKKGPTNVCPRYFATTSRENKISILIYNDV